MESTSLDRRNAAPSRMRQGDAEQVLREHPLRPSGGNPLSALYQPIETQLGEVERRLRVELESRYESLRPVLHHGTQLGGKRLRPALLLLAGQCVGELNEDHVVLGTVVEMVHTATLIHDDVIDQATKRRHVPTINANWGEHTSILLGDYLFAQSFRLAATLESTESCRWIGEAARQVCEGEMRQVLDRGSLDLDEETYIEMIRGKTAELCRVACMLGARSSGGDERAITAVADYGDALGIAFQIADDFLDLWGNGDSIGKTLGTDLEQGKITLPIIRLLQTAEPEEAAKIRESLLGPVETRSDAIRPWLLESDAAEYTLGTARQYRDRAVEALSCFPESIAKETLRTIANFAIARRF